MSVLLASHDLSCTIENLATAAKRSVRESSMFPPTADPTVNLLTAALEFAVQLAIDCGKQDPTAMRQLETRLRKVLVPSSLDMKIEIDAGPDWKDPLP
jgi:hypothetical protein